MSSRMKTFYFFLTLPPEDKTVLPYFINSW